MPMTTSASCSMAPDSRRSESMGLLFCLCSFARESWLRQSTGTPSSFAIIFIIRLMSDTAWVRLSLAQLLPLPADCMSCR